VKLLSGAADVKLNCKRRLKLTHYLVLSVGQFADMERDGTEPGVIA
jgi:hypothetical protein